MKRLIALLTLIVFLPRVAIAAPYVKFSSVTPTVDTSAYATGEVIGGILTFTGIVQHGIIVSAIITDASATAVDYDLYLFSARPTGGGTTDQAAFDPSDANNTTIIGVINFPSTSRYTASDNSVHFVANQAIPYYGVSANNGTGWYNIYGVLVSRGAPTFAGSGDVTIKLGISQD